RASRKIQMNFIQLSSNQGIPTPWGGSVQTSHTTSAPRMDSLLTAGPVDTYCQNIKQLTTQNSGTFFKVQPHQEYN
uniref:eIF3h C-terminal domain-containing protein n=1 Tax=Sus scrofa TaxID=9823 RepID=A0A8D0MAP6_PIG